MDLSFLKQHKDLYMVAGAGVGGVVLLGLFHRLSSSNSTSTGSISSVAPSGSGSTLGSPLNSAPQYFIPASTGSGYGNPSGFTINNNIPTATPSTTTTAVTPSTTTTVTTPVQSSVPNLNQLIALRYNSLTQQVGNFTNFLAAHNKNFVVPTPAQIGAAAGKNAQSAPPGILQQILYENANVGLLSKGLKTPSGSQILAEAKILHPNYSSQPVLIQQFDTQSANLALLTANNPNG